MVIGIDEVGRGCWAGPMVAAAVMFNNNFTYSDENSWKLGDSKKLNQKRRTLASNEIYKIAKVGVGWVEPSEIDEFGLSEANALAMLRAIKQLDYSQAGRIVIDGNINYLQCRICQVAARQDVSCRDNPCKVCSKIETVVGGDASIASVSAASIVAKVARDNYMLEQSKLFPGYGFEKHVGYGTKLHMEQLQKRGVTALHRRSYKPIVALL